MKLILEVLLMGLAVMLGAFLVPGVSVDGYGSALLAAILIAVTNATIGLVLRFFTFPLNFLTLGLVSFIISVLMILLVDHWMSGFNTSGFLSAAVLAIAVAVIKMILDAAFGVQKS
ncbi:phage holin family protein [Pedobacter sp. SL55]|uniref:phage holin family protein n=1 Tax=Pedobacter sp. SL55 TaxID=2995161 RepID=UPI00226DCCDB|nr:phage holin family protein [Pedobacter sp. SL55]WAC42693.1 phage holin family protein [Pedobacter sp. SL55]